MSKSLKNFFEDLIIVVASIIGVGFATGKEIENFFCFNLFFFVSISIFIILYYIFFHAVYKFKQRHNISSFFELNDKLFTKNKKIINFILIALYSVVASAMLAGINNIFLEVFNLTLPIPSIVLSIIIGIIIFGGVDRIKFCFSKFVPILLFAIFVNLFVNSYNFTGGFKNFHFLNFYKFDIKTIIKSIIFPLLYFGSNFVLSISSLMSIREKGKLIKNFSSIIFLVFLTLGCVTILGQTKNLSMPFLTSSKSLSSVFFWLYFISIIFAIFSSSVISCYNEVQLINSRSNFGLLIILLINLILSFLGFKFIIKYLFLFSGIIGLLYCILLIIKININKKLNK